MKRILAKVAAHLWNSSCLRRFCSSSPSALRSATVSGAAGAAKSSDIATKASAKSGVSYFLRLACLALFVAGFLWTRPPLENKSADVLLHKGWVWLDRNPCAADLPTGFYELSAESKSIELLITNEKILAAESSLPEPPFTCTAIPEPNFIQEI